MRTGARQGAVRQATRRSARPLRVLISTGPTREPIDAVRFLSNYSTGYMGAQLAVEALRRGHRVTAVSGPTVEPLPHGSAVIPVESAEEMARALRKRAGSADVVIMAAAVSDFRPARRARGKLRRRRALTLTLAATPDIIARLPRRRRQLVVGFALETGRVVARAERKLREKRLDLLIAQQAARSTRDPRGAAPFGRHRVRAWLVSRGGETISLGRLPKPRLARVLLDKIETLWYGQPGRTQGANAAQA